MIFTKSLRFVVCFALFLFQLSHTHRRCVSLWTNRAVIRLILAIEANKLISHVFNVLDVQILNEVLHFLAFSLYLDEELLSVRSGLSTATSLNVLLNQTPVPTLGLESLQESAVLLLTPSTLIVLWRTHILEVLLLITHAAHCSYVVRLLLELRLRDMGHRTSLEWWHHWQRRYVFLFINQIHSYRGILWVSLLITLEAFRLIIWNKSLGSSCFVSKYGSPLHRIRTRCWLAWRMQRTDIVLKFHFGSSARRTLIFLD